MRRAYVEAKDGKVVLGMLTEKGHTVESTIAHGKHFALYTHDGKYLGISKYIVAFDRISKIELDKNGLVCVYVKSVWEV